MRVYSAASMEAWRVLDQENISAAHGEQFIHYGLPCYRQKVQDAQVRPVYIDAASDAVWDSPLVDHDIAFGDDGAQTEECEVVPAVYSYSAPCVLASLRSELAVWAYNTFKAAELDTMYRLRDNAQPWSTYVEELRAGMESSR